MFDALRTETKSIQGFFFDPSLSLSAPAAVVSSSSSGKALAAQMLSFSVIEK